MPNAFDHRQWLNPALFVLFAVTAIGGVLMMFDAAPDAIEASHEWLGLCFLILAVLHVLLRSRSLLVDLKAKKLSMVALVAALVTSGVLVAVSDRAEKNRHETKRHSGKVETSNGNHGSKAHREDDDD